MYAMARSSEQVRRVIVMRTHTYVSRARITADYQSAGRATFDTIIVANTTLSSDSLIGKETPYEVSAVRVSYLPQQMIL